MSGIIDYSKDPRTGTLRPRDVILNGMHEEASQLFEAEKQDDAERICLEMLMYADMSDYFKARAHYMLSFGESDFLYHAQQAVELAENLFVARRGSSWKPGDEPTPHEVKVRDHLLNAAKESLALAEETTAVQTAHFEAQKAKFRETYGRDATAEDYVDAALEHMHEVHADYYENFEKAYAGYLQGEKDEAAIVIYDTEEEDIEGEEDVEAQDFGEEELEADVELTQGLPYMPPSPQSMPRKERLRRIHRMAVAEHNLNGHSKVEDTRRTRPMSSRAYLGVLGKRARRSCCRLEEK